MHTRQSLHHINVDGAVAIEGTATFDMSGRGGNQIRVSHQFADIADECPSGHVVTRDFID